MDINNPYILALHELKSQKVHQMKEIGDQWCTPEWLFWAIDALYGPLVVDLFTDGVNSKCDVYFTADDNALRQDWKAALDRGRRARCDWEDSEYRNSLAGGKCYANPPYSIKRAAAGRNAEHLTGMVHIMKKAYEEHRRGVQSVWLVKSATSESWWPDATCSRIIHIKGRIGFDLPEWYEPDIMEGNVSGAGFGASVVIFDGVSVKRQPEEYVDREVLREIGEPIAKEMEGRRKNWLRKFSDW